MFFNKKENIQIPFFPAYDFEENDNILVWWFEKNFSQSTFGKHAHKGTNSCTLITILTAEVIAREKLQTMATTNRMPPDIIKAFGLAILEGNATYARLSDEEKLPNINLNIPEAMEAVEGLLNSIQEWVHFYVHVQVSDDKVYAKSATQKLTSVLRDGLNMWQLVEFEKDYLFIVLIADNRSILLCFERRHQTVTLFDSHNHTPKRGAVIAQVKWSDLEGLILWIVGMFKKIYKSQPDIYELSFLPLR